MPKEIKACQKVLKVIDIQPIAICRRQSETFLHNFAQSKPEQNSPNETISLITEIKCPVLKVFLFIPVIVPHARHHSLMTVIFQEF